MDYPFQIACVQPPPPLRKKSEKGCLWGRGRLCTGQSQTDNPFLALVWKQLMTKFPCSVFLMIAKDSTERPSAIALSKALLLRAANAFRMTWSERIFSSDTPPKCLHRDCVGRRRTGTSMAMSTLASEKSRELLFIGNVFYKQWHFSVFFH